MKNRERGQKNRRGRKSGAAVMAAVLAASGIAGSAGQRPWGIKAWAAPQTVQQENGEDTEVLDDYGAAEAAQGDGQNEGAVTIRTTEEFLAFAQNCTSESYSKGRYFVLETDLNLQGTDFKPAPVFAGTFDGR